MEQCPHLISHSCENSGKPETTQVYPLSTPDNIEATSHLFDASIYGKILGSKWPGVTCDLAVIPINNQCRHPR